MDDFKSEDVTFIFAVGGQDCHYKNLDRCIRSIEKFHKNSKFLIIEFGKKLNSTHNKTVLDYSNAINFNAGKKVGYIIWKHKYIGALLVKTKYGIYVDTDTVLANDTIQSLLENTTGGIGVTQHFWVPNIRTYQARTTDETSINEFLALKQKINLSDDMPFFAGGVFTFEKNADTDLVFEMILKMYNEYYDGKDYVKSITDELFLAAALGIIVRLASVLNDQRPSL